MTVEEMMKNANLEPETINQVIEEFQKAGCTFYFKNGISQFVPGASLNELMDELNNDGDSDWVAYGNNLLIRVDQIVEIIDNNPEEG